MPLPMPFRLSHHVYLGPNLLFSFMTPAWCACTIDRRIISNPYRSVASTFDANQARDIWTNTADHIFLHHSLQEMNEPILTSMLGHFLDSAGQLTKEFQRLGSRSI